MPARPAPQRDAAERGGQPVPPQMEARGRPQQRIIVANQEPRAAPRTPEAVAAPAKVPQAEAHRAAAPEAKPPEVQHHRGRGDGPREGRELRERGQAN
jgi:hypothetical protein